MSTPPPYLGEEVTLASFLEAIITIFNLDFDPRSLANQILLNYADLEPFVDNIFTADDDYFADIARDLGIPAVLQSKLRAISMKDSVRGINCCLLCEKSFLPRYNPSQHPNVISFLSKIVSMRHFPNVITSATCHHTVCSQCFERYLDQYESSYFGVQIFCPGMLLSRYPLESFISPILINQIKSFNDYTYEECDGVVWDLPKKHPLFTKFKSIRQQLTNRLASNPVCSIHSSTHMSPLSAQYSFPNATPELKLLLHNVIICNDCLDEYKRCQDRDHLALTDDRNRDTSDSNSTARNNSKRDPPPEPPPRPAVVGKCFRCCGVWSDVHHDILAQCEKVQQQQLLILQQQLQQEKLNNQPAGRKIITLTPQYLQHTHPSPLSTLLQSNGQHPLLTSSDFGSNSVAQSCSSPSSRNHHTTPLIDTFLKQSFGALDSNINIASLNHQHDVTQCAALLQAFRHRAVTSENHIFHLLPTKQPVPAITTTATTTTTTLGPTRPASHSTSLIIPMSTPTASSGQFSPPSNQHQRSGPQTSCIATQCRWCTGDVVEGSNDFYSLLRDTHRQYQVKSDATKKFRSQRLQSPFPNAVELAVRDPEAPILFEYLGSTFSYSDALKSTCDGGLLAMQQRAGGEFLAKLEQYRASWPQTMSYLQHKQQVELSKEENAKDNKNKNNNNNNNNNQLDDVNNNSNNNNNNCDDKDSPNKKDLPLASHIRSESQPSDLLVHQSVPIPTSPSLADIMNHPTYAIQFNTLPFCVQLSLIACPHILPCGCFCSGVRGEHMYDCPPCIKHPTKPPFDELVDITTTFSPSFTNATTNDTLDEPMAQTLHEKAAEEAASKQVVSTPSIRTLSSLSNHSSHSSSLSSPSSHNPLSIGSSCSQSVPQQRVGAGSLALILAANSDIVETNDGEQPEGGFESFEALIDHVVNPTHDITLCDRTVDGAINHDITPCDRTVDGAIHHDIKPCDRTVDGIEASKVGYDDDEKDHAAILVPSTLPVHTPQHRPNSLSLSSSSSIASFPSCSSPLSTSLSLNHRLNQQAQLMFQPETAQYDDASIVECECAICRDLIYEQPMFISGLYQHEEVIYDADQFDFQKYRQKSNNPNSLLTKANRNYLLSPFEMIAKAIDVKQSIDLHDKSVFYQSPHSITPFYFLNFPSYALIQQVHQYLSALALTTKSPTVSKGDLPTGDAEKSLIPASPAVNTPRNAHKNLNLPLLDIKFLFQSGTYHPKLINTLKAPCLKPTYNEFTHLPPILAHLVPIPRQVCTHRHHYLCTLQQLEEGWKKIHSDSISFTYLKCNLCRNYIFHPILATELIKHYTLQQNILYLSLEQLYYEVFQVRCNRSLTYHDILHICSRIDEISNPHHNCQIPPPSDPAVTTITPSSQGSPLADHICTPNIYYQRPDLYVADKFVYYSCSRCERPYYGGHVDCQMQIQGNDNDINAEHGTNNLLCNSCNPTEGRVCLLHDEENLIYKCKFCCSEASYVCWGNTYFCTTHHATGVWQTLVNQKTGKNRDKLWSYPQCPSLKTQINQLREQHGDTTTTETKAMALRCDPKQCPLGIPHPPNGINFVIGCGQCGLMTNSIKAGKDKEKEAAQDDAVVTTTTTTPALHQPSSIPTQILKRAKQHDDGGDAFNGSDGNFLLDFKPPTAMEIEGLCPHIDPNQSQLELLRSGSLNPHYKPYFRHASLPTVLEADVDTFSQLSLYSYLALLRNIYHHLNLQFNSDFKSVFAQQRFVLRSNETTQFVEHNHGLLFYLGTLGNTTKFHNPHHRGIVSCTSTQLYFRSIPAWGMLERVDSRCVTCWGKRDDPGYFMLDLKHCRVIPTGYSFKHYNSHDTECIRSWKLEGSVDGMSWLELSRHHHDQSIKGRNSAGHWEIPTYSSKWNELVDAQLASYDGGVQNQYNTTLKYLVPPNLSSPIFPSRNNSNGTNNGATVRSPTGNNNPNNNNNKMNNTFRNNGSNNNNGVTSPKSDPLETGFRFFRITPLDNSDIGGRYFACVGFELYGALILPSPQQLHEATQVLTPQLLAQPNSDASHRSLSSPLSPHSSSLVSLEPLTMPNANPVSSRFYPPLTQSNLLPNMINTLLAPPIVPTSSRYELKRTLARRHSIFMLFNLLAQVIDWNIQTTVASVDYLAKDHPLLSLLNLPIRALRTLGVNSVLPQSTYRPPNAQSRFFSTALTKTPPPNSPPTLTPSASTPVTTTTTPFNPHRQSINVFANNGHHPAGPEGMCHCDEDANDPNDGDDKDKDASNNNRDAMAQARTDLVLDPLLQSEPNNTAVNAPDSKPSQSTQIITDHPEKSQWVSDHGAYDEVKYDNEAILNQTLDLSPSDFAALFRKLEQASVAPFNIPSHPFVRSLLRTAATSTLYPTLVYDTAASFFRYQQELRDRITPLRERQDELRASQQALNRNFQRLQCESVLKERQSVEQELFTLSRKEESIVAQLKLNRPSRPFSTLSYFRAPTGFPSNPARTGYINITASSMLSFTQFFGLLQSRPISKLLLPLHSLVEPPSPPLNTLSQIMKSAESQGRSREPVIPVMGLPYVKIYPSTLPLFHPDYVTHSSKRNTPAPPQYASITFDFGAYRISPTGYTINMHIPVLPLHNPSDGPNPLSRPLAGSRPNPLIQPDPVNEIGDGIMSSWIVEGSNGEFPNPGNSPLPYSPFNTGTSLLSRQEAPNELKRTGTTCSTHSRAPQLTPSPQDFIYHPDKPWVVLEPDGAGADGGSEGGIYSNFTSLHPEESLQSRLYRSRVAYQDQSHWTWYPLVIHHNDTSLKSHALEQWGYLNRLDHSNLVARTQYSYPEGPCSNNNDNNNKNIKNNNNNNFFKQETEHQLPQSTTTDDSAHPLLFKKHPTAIANIYVDLVPPSPQPDFSLVPDGRPVNYVCQPELDLDLMVDKNPSLSAPSVNYITDLLNSIQRNKDLPPLSSQARPNGDTSTGVRIYPHAHSNAWNNQHLCGGDGGNNDNYFNLSPQQNCRAPQSFKYIRIRSLHPDQPMYLSDIDFFGRLYTTTSSLRGKMGNERTTEVVLKDRYGLPADILLQLQKMVSPAQFLTLTKTFPQLLHSPKFSYHHRHAPLLPQLAPVLNAISFAYSYNLIHQLFAHVVKLAKKQYQRELFRLVSGKQQQQQQPNNQLSAQTALLQYKPSSPPTSTQQHHPSLQFNDYHDDHAKNNPNGLSHGDLDNIDDDDDPFQCIPSISVRVDWDSLVPVDLPPETARIPLFYHSFRANSDLTVLGGISTGITLSPFKEYFQRTFPQLARLRSFEQERVAHVFADKLSLPHEDKDQSASVPARLAASLLGQSIFTAEELQYSHLLKAAYNSREDPTLLGPPRPEPPPTDFQSYCQSGLGPDQSLAWKSSQVCVPRRIAFLFRSTPYHISTALYSPYNNFASKRSGNPADYASQNVNNNPDPMSTTLPLDGIFSYFGTRGHTQLYSNPSGSVTSFLQSCSCLYNKIVRGFQEIMGPENPMSTDDLYSCLLSFFTEHYNANSTQSTALTHHWLAVFREVSSPHVGLLESLPSDNIDELDNGEITTHRLSDLESDKAPTKHAHGANTTLLHPVSAAAPLMASPESSTHASGLTNSIRFDLKTILSTQPTQPTYNQSDSITLSLIQPPPYSNISYLSDAVPLRFCTHVFSSTTPTPPKNRFNSQIIITPTSQLQSNERNRYDISQLVTPPSVLTGQASTQAFSLSLTEEYHYKNPRIRSDDRFIVFDMGLHTRVIPTAYSLRIPTGLSDFSSCIPRNWQLLGSVDGNIWSLLSNHVNSNALDPKLSPSAVFSIPLAPMESTVGMQHYHYHYGRSGLDTPNNRIYGRGKPTATNQDEATIQYPSAESTRELWRSQFDLPHGQRIPLQAYRFFAILPLQSHESSLTPEHVQVAIQSTRPDPSSQSNPYKQFTTSPGSDPFTNPQLFGTSTTLPTTAPQHFSLTNVEFFGIILSSQMPMSLTPFPATTNLINIPRPYSSTIAATLPTPKEQLLFSRYILARTNPVILSALIPHLPDQQPQSIAPAPSLSYLVNQTLIQEVSQAPFVTVPQPHHQLTHRDYAKYLYNRFILNYQPPIAGDLLRSLQGLKTKSATALNTKVKYIEAIFSCLSRLGKQLIPSSEFISIRPVSPFSSLNPNMIGVQQPPQPKPPASVYFIDTTGFNGGSGSDSHHNDDQNRSTLPPPSPSSVFFQNHSNQTHLETIASPVKSLAAQIVVNPNWSQIYPVVVAHVCPSIKPRPPPILAHFDYPLDKPDCLLYGSTNYSIMTAPASSSLTTLEGTHPHELAEHSIIVDVGLLIQPKTYSLSHSQLSLDQLPPMCSEQDLSADSYQSRHFTPEVNAGYMRSWQLLGSADGINWNIISIHHNDITITSPGVNYRFIINPLGQASWYRYFKIKLTGPNHSDEWRICLSSFDLDGFVLIQ